VTHDTILGGMVHDLMGRVMENEEDWPRMLEGSFLWASDSTWHWTWRGRCYQSPAGVDVRMNP
jgi:hypothetical protein